MANKTTPNIPKFRNPSETNEFDKFVKPFSVETTKNIYGDSDYIKDLLKFDKDLIKSMKHQSIIGVY